MSQQMTKSQAEGSLKTIYSELASLGPSALITLFEINVGQLVMYLSLGNQAIYVNAGGWSGPGSTGNTGGPTTDVTGNDYTFRFHNNLKLGNSSIWWNGVEYIACPIKAEGFEMNTRGTLPVPKLTLTVSEQGIPALSMVKQYIYALGDITGAQVTRIRTLARCLDARNFPGGVEAPPRWSPDATAELPRDIFYIERMSLENKTTIEWELSSILDVENVKLPGRLCLATRCPATYRGEGCLYEYNSQNLPFSSLADAPPVADANDRIITDTIQGDILSVSPYNATFLSQYLPGDAVYINRGGVNYYFVCKVAPALAGPPNLNYWIPDQCSKSIYGCKLRWASQGDGSLPFNGFPAINKLTG